jgi:putative transposase
MRRRGRPDGLLERSLEEVKRRMKVIGRFPGETSCLSLCWAVSTRS